jgi:uncharacterized membrane protein YGL010W
MRQLSQYFEDYEEAHRTFGNEVCHFIGIPMIVVTLLGLLSAWVLLDSPIRIDGGLLLWGLGTLFYLAVGWRLGAPFSLVLLGAYFVGRTVPLAWLWAGFALGWLFQGIGHGVYEKKSPAFVRNLQHILIGPLWIFARALRVR